MLNYLQTNTMKKLLLVLLFVPLITFGQTAEDFFNSCKAKDSLKDFKGAIIGFNKAIGIDPNNAEYYYQRGYSKDYLKDF